MAKEKKESKKAAAPSFDEASGLGVRDAMVDARGAFVPTHAGRPAEQAAADAKTAKEKAAARAAKK